MDFEGSAFVDFLELEGKFLAAERREARWPGSGEWLEWARTAGLPNSTGEGGFSGICARISSHIAPTANANGEKKKNKRERRRLQ